NFIRTAAKDLPSGRFYLEFNHENENLNEYSKECNKLKSPYNRYGKVVKLCKQVLKYLKKYRASFNNVNDSYDVCVLLNYAAFSRLHEIFGPADRNRITLAWAYLNFVWNDFYKIKCKPVNNIYTNDWHIRKILYDYFVDYGAIKNIFSFYNDTCQKYYTYLEIIIDVYKYFNDFCTSDDNKDRCPDFFNKCKDYNPSTYIDKVICHNEMESRRSASKTPKLVGEEQRHSTELNSVQEFESLLPKNETDFSDNSILQGHSSDR
ncbi:hypothetical protein PCYB_007250, partial [Plasmodium cynomolgi strain B]